MVFAAEDLARFNALLDQALADPNARDSLKARLGVAPPPPPPPAAEPKAVNKTIEEKVYRRVDKYTGTAGTWQEWSFAFVNATCGVNHDVGKALEHIGHQCETVLTPENLARCVDEDTRQKHGPELFSCSVASQPGMPTLLLGVYWQSITCVVGSQPTSC